MHEHVRRFWPDHDVRVRAFDEPPVSKTLPSFAVIEVAPRRTDEPWVYVSMGAARAPGPDTVRREFVIIAAERDLIHHETLAMLANMYASERIDVPLGKIISIGRGWVPGSSCDHLLASHPYYQGPGFEFARAEGTEIHLVWLTPITSLEAAFAREQGQEALEALLESKSVNIVDPHRASIVCSGQH